MEGKTLQIADGLMVISLSDYTAMKELADKAVMLQELHESMTRKCALFMEQMAENADEIRTLKAELSGKSWTDADVTPYIPPAQPEFIPFDPEKWSGHVEDLKSIRPDNLTIDFAKMYGTALKVCWSNTANTTYYWGVSDILMRNPSYVNPPLTC